MSSQDKDHQNGEPAAEITADSIKVKLCLYLLLEQDIPASRLVFEKELNSKTVFTAIQQHTSKQINDNSTILFTHFDDHHDNALLCLDGERNGLLSRSGPFDLYRIQQTYDYYLRYYKKTDVNCAFFTNVALNDEILDYFDCVGENDSARVCVRGVDFDCYRLSKNKFEMFKQEWKQGLKPPAKKVKVDGPHQTKKEASLEKFMGCFTFYVCRQSKKDFETDLNDVLEMRVRMHMSPSLRRLDVYDFYFPELRKQVVDSNGKFVLSDDILDSIKHGQSILRSAVRRLTQFYSATLDAYRLHFEHGCLNTLEQFIYNPSSAIILNVVAAKDETAITTIKLRNLIRSREPKEQALSLFIGRNMLNECFCKLICEYFTLKTESPAKPSRHFLVVEAAGMPSKGFTAQLERLRGHFSAGKQSPFRILVITRADDVSLSGLQNIASLKDTELKWQDLSAKSQNILLNRHVESHASLQSLMLDKNSFIKKYMDFNLLTELVDVCDLALDFNFDCCGDFCVSRTLQRCPVLDGKAIESDDLISRLCLSADEFEDRCKEERMNKGHHLVSQFDVGKPGWLVWRKSSAGLSELRDFLIDDDITESNSVEIRDDQFIGYLVKNASETGKVVLVHGNDRYDTSCFLANLAKRMSWRAKMDRLPYWIVKCHWELPPSFERSTGLSSKALDVLVNYLVRWPADRKNAVAKALLRHRLETAGGRVVLMFHGDVEENALHAVEKMIRGLNTLPGVERIFVTCSDPKSLVSVENALNQFAFQINDINEDDRLSALIKCWSPKAESTSASASHGLMELFGTILLSKLTFFSDLHDTETVVKVLRIAASSFRSELEQYVLSSGQELCLKLDRPNSIFTLAELYRKYWAVACDSLASAPFCDYVNVADVKSFLHYHAMLALDIGADKFFPQHCKSFAMDGKKAPLLYDAARKMGLIVSYRGATNIVFYHDSLRDFFVADYFYSACSQKDANSDLLCELFTILMRDVSKFHRVLGLLDEMLRDNVRLGANFASSFDTDTVFARRTFNSLLSRSSLHALDVLNVAIEYGLSSIFCWVLTCAKGKSTRSSSSKFHEAIRSVLDAGKCWDFVLKVILSHGRIDSVVVAHIFKWFENGDRSRVEALLDEYYSITKKICDPNVLENSYDVLRVLVEFIAFHRVDIPQSFLIQWFFEGKKDSVPFMTLMTQVVANTPSDAQVKKQILQLLQSVFGAKAGDELGELLCTWLGKLQFNKVRDRLFFKQCTLFTCHCVPREHTGLGEVLKGIFKSDPRVFQTYNERETAFAGKLEAWEQIDFVSSLEWLDASEKALLLRDASAIEACLVSHDNEPLETVLTNLFKALGVAVRTGNKDVCELIKKLFEQYGDDDSTLAHDINDCFSSALACAIACLDYEWTIQMLETGESFLLSSYFNDSDLLVNVAKNCRLFWDEKFFTTEQFYVLLTKVVTIWDKRQEQQTISKFFINSGYKAFKCLALEKSSDATLKPILESVLKEEGDVRLVEFIFNPMVEDEFVKRTCQLLSNRQVRQFVPGRLTQDGFKCFLEMIFRDMPYCDEGNTSINVWKVYCSQRNKPSSHIKEIINCARELCDIDLFDEDQNGNSISNRSLNPSTSFTTLKEVESRLKSLPL